MNGHTKLIQASIEEDRPHRVHALMAVFKALRAATVPDAYGEPLRVVGPVQSGTLREVERGVR